MAVHIRTRATKSGVRFDVRYRTGGRGTRVQHAGTFTSLTKAEQTRDAIAARLARADAPPPSDESRVYIARLGGLIKIGISIDPVRRCRDLNADLLLDLPGGRERERQLHETFAECRQRGEWFEPAPELLEWIAQAAA